MAITATSRDAIKLRPVLNPDWKKMTPEERAGLDEVCLEVMQAALQVLEDKARFVAVGAVAYTNEDGYLDRLDPKAERTCVGYFNTEKQANDAARLLFGNSVSKVECRTMVYPIWKGTPAAWRKDYLERWNSEADKASGPNQAERMTLLRAEEHAAKPRCEAWTPDGPCVRLEAHQGRCRGTDEFEYYPDPECEHFDPSGRPCRREPGHPGTHIHDIRHINLLEDE